MTSLTTWSGDMSRHEISENLIEKSLLFQEKIDQAEKCIDSMDIKGLLDLGMIDRRIYQNWERAEQNEQDLVNTHGRDAYTPSFEHYNRAMEKADKNIKRLKKEVDDLITKSRSTLRQAMYSPKELFNSNTGKSLTEVAKLIDEEDVRSKLYAFVMKLETWLDAQNIKGDIKITEIKVSTHARLRGKPFYSVKMEISSLNTTIFFQNSTEGSGKSNEIATSLWVGRDLIKNLNGSSAKQLGQQIADLIANSVQSSRVASQYMNKIAGSGAENAKYLNSIPPAKKAQILKHIADHYGVSVREIEEELVDQDAERLFEYAATNNAMAMEIYRGMSRMATKTAASGNYGFTKRVQSDVEVALRKLEKKVNTLARFVETKHPEAGTYFSTRCQGSNCHASKALSGACLLNQKPKRVLSGPLGFKPSCAKSAHKAISDLILYTGTIAHTLHNKSSDHIPYLQTHAKKKRCPLTKLLLENYPVEIL